MPILPVYNMDGNQVGEMNLADTVFGIQVNKHLVHQAVLMQLATRRLGTAKAKTRSEVRGGGAKPWRQKGTGRARHGSRRSPIWTGGGVVFPPQPRSYGFKMPKKAWRQALRSALTSKIQDGKVIVLEDVKFEMPKTKAALGVLTNLKVADAKTLIVLAEKNENVQKSMRNLPGVLMMNTDGLNVYDVLLHDHLLLTKDAVGRIEEALA
ncbi:MAG TPA: 50S ribosomal protein L4 [Firmicutes bacterium]|jgi:large subunit ribosomal protein L4|nr:50S ribosomal protein L4 [Bacillota bacterium]HBR35460.1 50S ribosomal protein L4 [Bacillota bacterium]